MSLSLPSELEPAQTNAPTVITLDNVSVEFEGQQVLKGVNLEVTAGEFVALIGPSGGGKSTLLRVIAGLLKQSSGAVDVACKPAVVFQDYRLLPWRSVSENVRLPAEVTGRASGQGTSVTNVLKQVGMLEHADRYPQQLSGGMQARVAIARALAQEADILLMDEPFAALDALVRERFNLEMKRLHEKTGKTILFVTHSIREAVYLADKVVVLKDGQVDDVLDARGEGRITAYSDGIEASLRAKLGMATSTYIEHREARRFPWEGFAVIGLTALLFTLWQLYVSTANPPFVPSPAEIWEAGVDGASLLVRHGLATLRLTVLGILVSLGLGLPLGYLMGKKFSAERLIFPYIIVLQAVPTVIVAPLLALSFGTGFASRLIVTVLISIFPVIVAALVGVREVDKVYREVFATIGASRWTTFRALEFPGALPVVLGGLRLAASLALIGAVVSEFVFGSPGLGYLTNSQRLQFRFAEAYAAVSATVVMGLVLYGLVRGLESYVLRYRRA